MPKKWPDISRKMVQSGSELRSDESAIAHRAPGRTILDELLAP